MKFPAKLLAADEEVYLDARPNWSYLFWPTVLTVLVLAACIAVVVLWSSAPTYTGWVLLGCGLAVFAYFLARYIAWLSTSFVVTSQRIVYRYGVVRRTGREIPIGRVQDVTYHQTIVERIVRAGSLTVESAGRHGQDPFPDISRPAEVQSLINRVVGQAAGMGFHAAQAPVMPVAESGSEEVSQPITDPTPRAAAHEETHVESEPVPSPPVTPAPSAPAAPVPPPPGIAQQMNELADLHRHGVITDAEYEQKRRELLDRL